jgi:hypothetical protein
MPNDKYSKPDTTPAPAVTPEPEPITTGDNPSPEPEVVEVKPISASNARRELATLEARRAELKAQSAEQAKERDPKEYGRVKSRIAELKAELGIQ